MQKPIHVSAGKTALVWFRRDLRDDDNSALAEALTAFDHVHGVFVFDRDILDALDPDNRRVTFLWDCVAELRRALEARGGGLQVLHDRAVDAIPRLAGELGVDAVLANRDVEPAAQARDRLVAERLSARGIDFRAFKDQAVFELEEVRTKAGGPFAVFTPYKRAWLEKLRPVHVAARDTNGPGRLASASGTMPSVESLGFRRQELVVAPGMAAGRAMAAEFRKNLAHYAVQRDFPALAGTSRLSAHLRFGTVSIRSLVRMATATPSEGADTWLSELIWREFYAAILAARPDVVERSFRPEYDALEWDDVPGLFDAWRDGRTGYPIVDAAMRELKATGWMHNRLRMVVASFLVKDLGIDWRRGAAHFARELLDHDLAANNGGWQWCASTGCDAQPWFRIFNPVSQSKRFDAEGAYTRRWVPEVAKFSDADIHAPWEASPIEQQAAGCIIGRDYPAPVVRHEEARKRTLARYTRIKPVK